MEQITSSMRKLTHVLFVLAGLIGYGTAVANADSSGTGFVIGNGNSVLTNFHVVDGCQSVRVANVEIGVIKTVDRRNDIAVIQSGRPISASLRLRVDDEVKPGEEIVVIGFPLRGILSSAPTVTTGIVSSVAGLHDDRTRMQISAPIQPGNSGGPVLDRAGNVVGMVVSTLNVLRIAPMIPQNVNFAIPASVITSVLDANSIKYQVGTASRQKSVAEVVAAASPAVVSLECLGREQPATTTGIPAVPSPAARGDYGAIAWDQQSGRRGWSWNQNTAQRAAEVALSECGASGCKVIIRTGRTMCAALATTEDGKFIGAASRQDRDAARLAALANCNKGTTGECIVRMTDCNK
jgi:S1-C subfamily serine protease